MSLSVSSRLVAIPAFCVAVAGGAWPSVVLGEAAAPVAGQAAVFDFSIAPASLNEVLGRFGEQARIMVGADLALTQGVRSGGVRGRHTAGQALDILLRGTGLEARPATGGYRLRKLPAVAGQAPVAAQLAPVHVTGRLQREREVYETPGSVAVITREQIDRLPPRNTSDLLVDVPGVYTSQGRQNPGVSINLRGMQDFGRVNVMIDGARQNYQQSGHGSNGQVYVDTELLGGVDIAKGPVSTVGGAGMIAGMVNFRTLDYADLVAEGKAYGGRVNLSTGGNAYHFAGSAALGVKLREDVEAVFAVSRKKVGEFERGYRNNAVTDTRYGRDQVSHGVTRLSAQDQTSALAKATWRLAPGHRLRLSYVGFDAKFNEGDSGDSLYTSADVRTRNHVRSDTLLAGYEWRPAGSRWVDLASTLYYTRTRNNSERNPGSLDANEYRLQYQTSTVGGTLQNTSRLDAGGLQALLKVGGEFFHDWTTPKAQALTVGADAGTARLWTGGTPEGQRTVASLFGEASLLRGDWLDLTGGLRYDWYGLKGDGLMRVGSITNPAGVLPSTTTIYTRFNTDRHDSAISPRLSLAIKPVQQVQLFANIGRGMRPPAITESLMWGQHVGGLFPYFPNPNLQAERSRNWEVGANLIFDGLLAPRDTLRMKAAWFNSKVRNYITLSRIMSPTSTGGSGIQGPYAYMNLDSPFHSKGLELSADYDAGTVFASVNHTRMIIDTGEGGYNPFPLGSLTGYPANSLGQPGDANIWYVLPPRRSFSLSGGVRLLERKLTLGARVRYQSPTANTSSWTSGDFYNDKSWRLYDLWASYDVNRRVTLRLAVNNLRDTNYSELQGGAYFVGPGRTVIGTVSFKF